MSTAIHIHSGDDPQLEALLAQRIYEYVAYVIVASHSFQAPDFDARRAYLQVARVEDHPVGHASVFFTKRLATEQGKRT